MEDIEVPIDRGKTHERGVDSTSGTSQLRFQRACDDRSHEYQGDDAGYGCRKGSGVPAGTFAVRRVWSGMRRQRRYAEVLGQQRARVSRNVSVVFLTDRSVGMSNIPRDGALS